MFRKITHALALTEAHTKEMIKMKLGKCSNDIAVARNHKRTNTTRTHKYAH